MVALEVVGLVEGGVDVGRVAVVVTVVVQVDVVLGALEGGTAVL